MIKNIRTKLAELQGSIKETKKDANGMAGRYKYMSLGEILKQIKPVMERLKLSIVESFEPLNNGKDELFDSNEKTVYVTGLMTMTLFDGESDEMIIVRSVASAKNVDKAKAIGSAHTYTRRYLLESLLNITGDMRLDPDQIDYDAIEKEDKKTPKKEVNKVAVSTGSLDNNISDLITSSIELSQKELGEIIVRDGHKVGKELVEKFNWDKKGSTLTPEMKQYIKENK